MVISQAPPLEICIMDGCTGHQNAVRECCGVLPVLLIQLLIVLLLGALIADVANCIMESQTEQCCTLWPTTVSGLLDPSLDHQQATENWSTVEITAKSLPIHSQAASLCRQ